MLFKILLPGKHPFSHAGGEGPAENIRAGRFPYPVGDRRGEDLPDGPWPMIWSHLTFKVKEAFGKCFVEGKPVAPAEWGRVLKGYLWAIEQGHSSDDMFPELRKRVSVEAQRKHGFTQIEMSVFTCRSCDKPFERPKSGTDAHREPDTCPSCHKAHRLAAERSGPEQIGRRKISVAPRPTPVYRPTLRSAAPATPKGTAPPAMPQPAAGDGLLVSLLKAILRRS